MYVSTLVLPIGVAALVAIGLVARVARRRARQRLAALARSRGLSYRVYDVLDLPQRYHALTLMREGHDRRVRDVMTGPTRCGALSCFTFSYEVGFGVSRSVRSWLVAVLETDRRCGRVTLRRGAPEQAQGVPWCETVASRPIPRSPGAACTIDHRGGDAVSRLPSPLLDWLDTTARAACVEVCDGLIAVQVLRAGEEPPVEWIIDAVQTVARLLAEARAAEQDRGDDPSRDRQGAHLGASTDRFLTGAALTTAFHTPC